MCVWLYIKLKSLLLYEGKDFEFSYGTGFLRFSCISPGFYEPSLGCDVFANQVFLCSYYSSSFHQSSLNSESRSCRVWAKHEFCSVGRSSYRSLFLSILSASRSLLLISLQNQNISSLSKTYENQEMKMQISYLHHCLLRCMWFLNGFEKCVLFLHSLPQCCMLYAGQNVCFQGSVMGEVSSNP